MLFLKYATRIAAYLGLSLAAASAADLSSDPNPAGDFSFKAGAAPGADYWIVTVGALGGMAPAFPGSNIERGSGFPVIDIHSVGAIEWLGLPTDPLVSLTLYHSGFFRIGAAADWIFNRDTSITSAVKGLRDIDYTIETGAFVEYYPVEFLRLRADLLQGVTGSDGFQGNLKADAIYRLGTEWIFTAGPRLGFADTQYSSTFFSVNTSEAIASNLPAFHASGGLNTAGVDATVRYYMSETFSVRGFADYERLVGDAADSPIVRYRGSPDQFVFGLGAAYRFTYPR